MGHDGPEHDHGRGHGVPDEHKAHAPAHVACFVITSSDTRTPQTDAGGKAIREALESGGHSVVGEAIVQDEAAALKAAIDRARQAGARAVIVTGGTGIGRRDVTVEVVEALFDKRLPGFGELFRMLSYQEVGSAAMMSRAAAGTFEGMVLFALPGSPAAVRLAMDKLILPELGHAVREMTR